MKRKIYVLGSGAPAQRRPDHVYVDVRPFSNVDLVIDLETTPWPIEDGAARHINATHLLEHITNYRSFMDECWRICSPGGSMFFEVPSAEDVLLAWSDPTHSRAFTKHSFINYLTVEGLHWHGQQQHAWTIVNIEKKGGVIRGHLFPVPDECRTDETIAMWEDYKKNYSHAN